MFQNISDFNDTSDYLPIFNASLIADIVIIFMLYYTNIFGDPKKLKLWYEKYRLSAVIADVFILIIGMILGRFFYYKVFEEYSFTKFVFLILAIQIIHDYLFNKFFSAVPRGTNNMLDLFKDYAIEVKAGAILGDSFMMLLTILLSSYFKGVGYNNNIIILVLAFYLLPYILYIK